MYDKLCVSSPDRNYPRDLIRRIGASELENAKKIDQHVRELSIEKVKRDAELLTAQKANLTAEQAYSLMDGPFGWHGTEGVIYVEKSLSDAKSPEEVFDRLTADFERQSIFRKLQSLRVCAPSLTLTNPEAGPTKELMSKFLEKWQDRELPLLNKVECAWIRVVRKNLIISAYPLIDKKLSESLRSAPELERFVLPPTGFNDALLYELAVHDGTFRQLLAYSEPDLESELRVIEAVEASLEEPLRKAPKQSPIYRDSAFIWFQNCGADGKHFAFKHIAPNMEIMPRPEAHLS